MKTYQFAVFAALMALILVAVFYGKRKKKCGCGMADPVTVPATSTTEDDE